MENAKKCSIDVLPIDVLSILLLFHKCILDSWCLWEIFYGDAKSTIISQELPAVPSAVTLMLMHGGILL